MIEVVCIEVGYDKDNSDHQARAITWLQQAQMYMLRYNFPELCNFNTSFTTSDGSPYDLTDVITSTFWRVIDKSVRCGTHHIFLTSKSEINLLDPALTWGGEPKKYAMENRTKFFLWPDSSGDTIYLDWIRRPTTMEAGLSEIEITYYADKHELIVEGAIWRGEHTEGDTKWYEMKKQWEKSVAQAYAISSHVQAIPMQMIPIDF
jgi:hypothetical protein